MPGAVDPCVVYDKMFSQRNVPTHILQRDYAQLIIEKAYHWGALPKNIKIERCRPPYHSKWPKIISEKKAKELENRDGWNRIKYSLQPESTGHYGDFGRYVMDFAVHHFSSRNLYENYNDIDRFVDIFDGMTARRYIMGEILGLGWRPELFKDYEEHLPSGRMRVDEEENKVERISKKYQWIGLYKLLGSLSDHYWMCPDYGKKEPETFSGAWQILVRDFDPSQIIQTSEDNFNSIENESNIFAATCKDSDLKYPDPFSDIALRLNREAWVTTLPDSFETIIDINNLRYQTGKWLNLSGHFQWNEELHVSQDETKDGTLQMWSDLRCWLVKKEDKGRFIDFIKDIKFWGNGCHNPELNDRWIGEYPWFISPRQIRDCFVSEDWLGLCTVNVKQTVCVFNDEMAGIEARLPGAFLFDIMSILCQV